MFKYISLLAMTSSLFAVGATVKKADIVVSVNAKEVALKKDAHIELTEGSTVCFVSGKGKLTIPTLKKQLKKPNRCLTLMNSVSEVTSYIKDIKNSLNVSLWDSSEDVHHGVGTKGKTEYDSNAPIVVKKGQKELVVTGEFGPLDVTTLLLDKNGKEVMVFENTDSDITVVKIPKEQLQTGMRLEIYNGFEDLLVRKRIIIE